MHKCHLIRSTRKPNCGLYLYEKRGDLKSQRCQTHLGHRDSNDFCHFEFLICEILQMLLLYSLRRKHKRESTWGYSQQQKIGASFSKRWCVHTLTVVRLSNVKDLICPFSKNTFNTFGMRSKESSLSIV